MRTHETRTSGLGFIEDVSILAKGTSTEENCKVLEKLHQRWASTHGLQLASNVTNSHQSEINLNMRPRDTRLEEVRGVGLISLPTKVFFL